VLHVNSYNQELAGTQNAIVQFTDTVEPERSHDFDFFASDEPLQITLRFDIREFLKTKNNPVYLDAMLTVKTSDADSLSQNIKVKARGFMRRSYCNFPPVMLKFKNNDNEAEQIQKKGTLKLVTRCNNSTLFENYVLREFLVYRLYNMLTPYSFRTRLVHVNYIDINKPEKSYASFGFLIENEDKMAERNHAVIIKVKNATQKDMTSMDMTRIAVFNYMIGNTDWSVPFQHNIKIMKSLEAPSDKAIPVIYDFDYSAVVNAIYAVPFEELPIKDVSERYYMGLCDRDEEVNAIVDELTGLKEKFMDAVWNFEYLSKGDKKFVESYLGGFYAHSDSKKYLLSELNRTCKQF
jgi:hypothetical protein